MSTLHRARIFVYVAFIALFGALFYFYVTKDNTGVFITLLFLASFVITLHIVSFYKNAKKSAETIKIELEKPCPVCGEKGHICVSSEEPKELGGVIAWLQNDLFRCDNCNHSWSIW